MADPEGTCLGTALCIFIDHGYAAEDGTVMEHEKLLDAVTDAMIEQWRRGYNSAISQMQMRWEKGINSPLPLRPLSQPPK